MLQPAQWVARSLRVKGLFQTETARSLRAVLLGEVTQVSQDRCGAGTAVAFSLLL